VSSKYPWTEIHRWAARGGLAVLDQALFSGANFIVNILLARWLPPEEYGAFAVAMSIFYLLAGFHTAVITEPMMVFGAGKYREHFKKYLGMLLWGHWAVSGLIAIILGISALFFIKRGSPMGEALLGLAIASPFLLFLWLTRRACYTNFKQGWAVGASGINLLATLLGIILLWKVGTLSTLTGIVALGVAAGVASFMLTSLHLRPQVIGYSGNPTPGMVLKDHKWISLHGISSLFAFWFSGHAISLLTPIVLGLEATALLNAVGTLFRPINQFIAAYTLIALPSLSAEFNYFNIPKSFGMVPIVIIYCVVILVFGKYIYIYLFPQYNIGSAIVTLYALTVIISSILGSCSTILKANKLVSKVAKAHWIAATFTIVTFIPFIKVYGVYGILLTVTVSYLVAIIFNLYSIAAYLKSNKR